MARRIVVGIDGTQGGSDAMALARRLSTPQTEVTAVSVALVDLASASGLIVVQMPPWPVSGETTTGAELAADVEAMADSLAALPNVESTTVAGDVVEELARFADEVDLLVVGSHQRGPVGRVLLGSTSEAMAHRCTRPLVVVPRTALPAASAAASAWSTA